MGVVKRRVYQMIGPHNEQSDKAEREEESTFAWDETNVLI